MLYSMSMLCRLVQVSRSGYYAYRRRHSVGPEDNGHNPLVLRANGIYEETWGSYESRRMARQLQEEGHRVGRYRARSLMCKAGRARATVPRDRSQSAKTLPLQK